MQIKRCSRRAFLKGIAAAACLSAGIEARTASAGRRRRKPLNFVFFLIDDLGWADLGCYGSTYYETPNIDRLAAAGMRFTDAYAACPVCSPTRASIMTGKYPARTGITDWIPGQRRNGKLMSVVTEMQMKLEEVTLAEAFKEAGYGTCFVGKWHLGADSKYWPDQQGFDVNIGGAGYGAPGSYFHPYLGQSKRSLPGVDGGKDGEYLTDRLTDEALKYLDSTADKPFLLYFAHYAVHTPIQAKKQLIAKYEKKKSPIAAKSDSPDFIFERDSQARQKQENATYAAMIQSVDESVGRVLDKLDKLGVADNTAVIFMSDNGGLSTLPKGRNLGPTSNVPLRAGKGWVYEGGIREPMIIKWPGVAKPSSTCDAPVTSTDFYPTMLDMASLPARASQHVDGVSLAPLLKGGKSLDREAIYWHYPHYHGSGSRPSGAMRAGSYKLVEFYEDNDVELYDLQSDIRERRNLADAMPEKTRQLRARFAQWRSDVGAKMPKPNPDYDGNG